MRDAMDMHTHTLASGHAYNTIMEMARSAADRGLDLLGITEHGPAMEGSCTKIYFINLKAVDRELFGIQLMLGVELNILDYEGRVDLGGPFINGLDYAIASLHSICIEPGTMRQNTGAYLGAMENKKVKIIGHPDDGSYPVDYQALVLGARDRHVLLEVNNASLMPGHFRKNSRENNIEMLKLCMRYQVPVIVSSDAHFASAVGRHENAMALLDELSFPEELVINHSAERFRAFIAQ